MTNSLLLSLFRTLSTSHSHLGFSTRNKIHVWRLSSHRRLLFPTSIVEMHFIHFTPQDTTNTRFPGFAQLNTRNPTSFFFCKRLSTLPFLWTFLSTRSASSQFASRACFLLCFHCIVAPLGVLPTRPTTTSRLSSVFNIFTRFLVLFEVIFNVGLLAIRVASSLGCLLAA